MPINSTLQVNVTICCYLSSFDDNYNLPLFKTKNKCFLAFHKISHIVLLILTFYVEKREIFNNLKFYKKRNPLINKGFVLPIGGAEGNCTPVRKHKG